VLLFLFTLATASIHAADSPRERISINDNRQFTKCDPDNDSASISNYAGNAVSLDKRHQQVARKILPRPGWAAFSVNRYE
jgi:hypothetical protein